MQPLLTKNFFKFLLGFVAILAVAFIVMFAVGFYGNSLDREQLACPEGQNCERGLR